tara:strand:- start:297 stop:536 length:240 start_codon:yes stop_codon:yes gene_type:complete
LTYAIFAYTNEIINQLKKYKNMSNETEKKQIELPTKKEQAINVRNKEDEFLDYLGINREDLSDDGADLQELKELGGFND